MASYVRVRRRRAPRTHAGLVVVPLLVASLLGSWTAPSVGAEPTPAVRLLHVSTAVRAPGQPVAVALTRTGPALSPGATVQLTLYTRLTTRSGLVAAIGVPGPSGPVSTTGALPVRCVTVGAHVALAVPVAPDGVAVGHRTMCGHPAPVLRLGCASGCDGVYPLRVTVAGGGAASTIDTLLTYAAGSTTPLDVAWVLRVAGGPSALDDAVPALAGLAAGPVAPVSLDVQGQSLATAPASPATSSALGLVRSVAARPSDQLLGEAYVAADLGALRASGLAGEVGQQFALTTSWLHADGVAVPAPSVTYATGPQTATSADAVAAAGYRQMVVPGSALNVDPAGTQGWGAPFRIGGAPAGATALASDTELATLSQDTTADPGLVAADFVGELAFLHYEAPNLADPRVAVVVTRATSTVAQAFVNGVLSGLRANPVLDPVTISQAFRQVPLGANGLPAVRAVAPVSSDPYGPHTVGTIRHLRITTDSLASAVRGGSSPIPSLDGQLLSAEQPLPAGEQTAILNHVQTRLQDQLGFFRIYDGPITLTSSGASLPITVYSTAPYGIAGFVHLHSPELQFPDGATTTLPGPVTAFASIRVSATAQVTGDIPLTAQLLSPTGHLVMTTAHITVRATRTSVVGIALTVLAVAVLALWWIRAARKRRAAR
jgi:hypothetical protein